MHRIRLSNRDVGMLFCIISTLLLAGCGGGGGSESTGNAATPPSTPPANGSTTVVTTIAGTGAVGSVNATGLSASFNKPAGIATDGTNLYVADSLNNTIRKVVIATGNVTTLAGTASALGGTADGTGAAASFITPSGITADSTNTNLYVTDTYGSSIRKIEIATGAVTTLAGAAATGLVWPSGITTDGTHLFVTDFGNFTIRKIVIASGVTTTLAGSAGIAGTANGTGAAARFITPTGITHDGTFLYVTDGHKIRKISIATGEVSTLAGSGVANTVDGTGTAASFNEPFGITCDGTNLYVADMTSQAIRKVVLATGVVTTMAGTATVRGNLDGTGTAATFNNPSGITIVGSTIYVADTGNSTIRKLQ